jgi:Protein of unknown function (DUF998)
MSGKTQPLFRSSLSPSSPSRQRWIVASAFGLALFLLIVASLGLLEAGYDPLRQRISELIHTGGGRLVQVGFLAWAFSLVVLGGLVVTSPSDLGRQRTTVLAAAGLGMAVAGLLLVACFATDRGAEVAGEVVHATSAGRLHDIGSTLVAAGISLAVLACGIWRRDFRLLGAIIAAAAVLSGALLLGLGDPLPGLRQRCLVACACFWQAMVLLRLRASGPTSG